MNSTMKLPSQIKVGIVREKDGTYFAELSDYRIFTEADSFRELIFNVNDLVYSFFDVKKEDRGKFWYLPPTEQQHEEKPQMNPILFNVLTRPGVKYRFA